jgi:hypothetical protein
MSVNTVRELRPHFLDPSGRAQKDLGPPGDFNGTFWAPGPPGTARRK